MVKGFDWTINDTYAAQTMCPYETVRRAWFGVSGPASLMKCKVAYGYSRFCDLFNYDEWVGFEYAIDLSFAGNNMFQSPTSVSSSICPLANT